MSNENNDINPQVLGDFFYINMKEKLPCSNTVQFAKACDYRLKQVSFLMDKTIEKNSNISIEDLKDNHLDLFIDNFSGECSNALYYSKIGYATPPINMFMAEEYRVVFDKACEYARFQPENKEIRDIELHKSLHRSTTYTPASEEESKNIREQIKEKNKQNRILNQQEIDEFYEREDTKVSFVETDEIALDTAYTNGVRDIFQLFRVCQFDIMNDFEKKIMISQLRDVHVEPDILYPEDESKDTIYNMFEANALILLKHYEVFEGMRRLYGNNPICDIIDENLMAGYFETAQACLKASLDVDPDTDFRKIMENNDQVFYKITLKKEFIDYQKAISKKENRFAFLATEDEFHIGTEFSSLVFNKLSPKAQESFDNLFNKELRKVAWNNYMPTPTNPAAYFREKSLKYDMFL